MRSAVVLTEEMDDIELAASELAAAVRRELGAFDRSAVGIVYCDADTDVAYISGSLHEELGIHIVGLTTTAVIERDSGHLDSCISLCVLTGDDVDIAVATTDALSRERFAEQIEEAYARARAQLPGDPKLVLAYSPFSTEITAENFVEVLDRLSGNAPIFGGVASDHYDLVFHKTFCDGMSNDSALQIVLISGEIAPVFAMKHRFSSGTERRGVITKSTGNRVELVGDESFKDFLSKMTKIPADESAIFSFQSTPFVMELPDRDSSEEPVVRDLYTIDHTTGAGVFLSKMPEGSKLSICLFKRDDIMDSCRETLDELERQMEASGGKFSTILVTTCSARHVIMGDAVNAEIDLVAERIKKLGGGISSMGFYAFGEICPTKHEGPGGTKNHFHNASFALCAF